MAREFQALGPAELEAHEAVPAAVAPQAEGGDAGSRPGHLVQAGHAGEVRAAAFPTPAHSFQSLTPVAADNAAPAANDAGPAREKVRARG